MQIQIADPQPAGHMCGVQTSDPQTDRVVTEHVRVSCSGAVCLRFKGNSCFKETKDFNWVLSKYYQRNFVCLFDCKFTHKSVEMNAILT